MTTFSNTPRTREAHRRAIEQALSVVVLAAFAAGLLTLIGALVMALSTLANSI